MANASIRIPKQASFFLLFVVFTFLIIAPTLAQDEQGEDKEVSAEKYIQHFDYTNLDSYNELLRDHPDWVHYLDVAQMREGSSIEGLRLVTQRLSDKQFGELAAGQIRALQEGGQLATLDISKLDKAQFDNFIYDKWTLFIDLSAQCQNRCNLAPDGTLRNGQGASLKLFEIPTLAIITPQPTGDITIKLMRERTDRSMRLTPPEKGALHIEYYVRSTGYYQRTKTDPELDTYVISLSSGSRAAMQESSTVLELRKGTMSITKDGVVIGKNTQLFDQTTRELYITTNELETPLTIYTVDTIPETLPEEGNYIYRADKQAVYHGSGFQVQVLNDKLMKELQSQSAKPDRRIFQLSNRQDILLFKPADGTITVNGLAKPPRIDIAGKTEVWNGNWILRSDGKRFIAVPPFFAPSSTVVAESVDIAINVQKDDGTAMPFSVTSDNFNGVLQSEDQQRYLAGISGPMRFFVHPGKTGEEGGELYVWKDEVLIFWDPNIRAGESPAKIRLNKEKLTAVKQQLAELQQRISVATASGDSQLLLALSEEASSLQGRKVDYERSEATNPTERWATYRLGDWIAGYTTSAWGIGSEIPYGAEIRSVAGKLQYLPLDKSPAIENNWVDVPPEAESYISTLLLYGGDKRYYGNPFGPFTMDIFTQEGKKLAVKLHTPGGEREHKVDLELKPYSHGCVNIGRLDQLAVQTPFVKNSELYIAPYETEYDRFVEYMKKKVRVETNAPNACIVAGSSPGSS